MYLLVKVLIRFGPRTSLVVHVILVLKSFAFYDNKRVGFTRIELEGQGGNAS